MLSRLVEYVPLQNAVAVFDFATALPDLGSVRELQLERAING